jgi:hypothetical protein
LTDQDPFSLLLIGSMLMLSTDTRRNHRFDPSGRSQVAADARANLVARIIEDPTPEASALLAVVAELAGADEELVKAIRAELATRPPLTPKWLARLGQTQIHRAVLVSHVLDEADDLLLEGRMPGAGTFTCAVKLDGWIPYVRSSSCTRRSRKCSRGSLHR